MIIFFIKIECNNFEYRLKKMSFYDIKYIRNFRILRKKIVVWQIKAF